MGHPEALNNFRSCAAVTSYYLSEQKHTMKWSVTGVQKPGISGSGTEEISSRVNFAYNFHSFYEKKRYQNLILCSFPEWLKMRGIEIDKRRRRGKLWCETIWRLHSYQILYIPAIHLRHYCQPHSKKILEWNILVWLLSPNWFPIAAVFLFLS